MSKILYYYPADESDQKKLQVEVDFLSEKSIFYDFSF